MRWMVEAFFSAVKRKFGVSGEAEGKERRRAPSGGYAALLVLYDNIGCYASTSASRRHKTAQWHNL